MSRRFVFPAERCGAAWACAVLGSLLALAPLWAAGAGVTDEDVAQCIQTLQQTLLNAQNDNGTWSYSGGYDTGTTALVVLALANSGVPSDHPAIVAGVKFILSHSDKRVYSEGLVPCALELVGPKRYARRIAEAARFLESAQGPDGDWSYATTRGGGDNSNTQFAILGLGAAERCGVAISSAVRARALDHWLRTQNEDGGWSYNRGDSTFSMTCAGVASLHLLGRRLERQGDQCGEYRTDLAMKNGLRRMESDLESGIPGGGHPLYTLYALERVAMFLQLRSIGNCDWYRSGAAFILSRGFRNTPDLAFALLFLAKGNTPIAIGKWQWNGDSNNDHSDAAAWTATAGTDLEMKLDWWVAHPGPGDPGSTRASMIYANGHGRFDATERELAFLRTYLVKQKGTLIAEACCNSKEFADSFQKVLLEKLFPNTPSRFEPVPPDHPVLTIHHTITPQDLSALQLKVGCRNVKVLLLTRDISCALNGENSTRGTPSAVARKIATNLLAWAMQTRKPGGKLSDPGAVASPEDETLTTDRIARIPATRGDQYQQPIGRLMHRGEWDADPALLPALQAALKTRNEWPHFDGEFPVHPLSDDLFHTAVVVMTGHEDPALKEPEWLNLRAYLQNGGFLLASSCCSSGSFDSGFRRLLKQVLPNDSLEPVPATDSIWLQPFACRSEPALGTRAYTEQYQAAWAPLLGIRRDGRWIVIYSPVDLCCGFDHELDPALVAYHKDSAFRLVANIVSYACTP